MKATHTFIASCTTHLLIVAFVCYQLSPAAPVKYGNDQREIISSYLVNTPTVAANAKPAISQTATPTATHAIALQTQKKTSIENQPKHSITRTRAATKGAPMPELIALLHSAIQQAQHYPASAQEMGREGRTTVAFTLYRNGTISDLQLLHSSGTTSLDNAALAAVSDAAPFQQVDRYLETAQPYQIDVVFSLS